MDRDDSLIIGTISKGMKIKGSIADAIETTTSAKPLSSDRTESKLYTAALLAYCNREFKRMPIEAYLVYHHFMMFLLDNSGIVDMDGIKQLRDMK